MKKRILLNRQNLKSNEKHGGDLPVFTVVSDGLEQVEGNRVTIRRKKGNRALLATFSYEAGHGMVILVDTNKEVHVDTGADDLAVIL